MPQIRKQVEIGKASGSSSRDMTEQAARANRGGPRIIIIMLKQELRCRSQR